MAKQSYFNIGGIVGVALVVCAICNVLLNGNVPLLSINTMQAMINRWVTHWHILAIGVLPIYVAFILFGAIVGGLFLGSALQRWLMRLLKRV